MQEKIKNIVRKIKDAIKNNANLLYPISDIKALIYEEYYANLIDKSVGLNKFERKIYSQHGEDGIINEVFKRIGTTNKFFFEFGAGTNYENNSVYLLINDWSGVWLDGNPVNYKFWEDNFKDKINAGKLRLSKDIITSKNINELTQDFNIPKDLDFLSIDVDGNDYYIWKACDLRPKLLCIEYNSTMMADSYFLDIERGDFWTGGNYFGTGLKKLTELCNKKGYSLIATDLSGANAFFVKNEDASKFENANDVEKLYNPPRYFLAAHRPINPSYKSK